MHTSGCRLYCYNTWVFMQMIHVFILLLMLVTVLSLMNHKCYMLCPLWALIWKYILFYSILFYTISIFKQTLVGVEMSTIPCLINISIIHFFIIIFALFHPTCLYLYVHNQEKFSSWKRFTCMLTSCYLRTLTGKSSTWFFQIRSLTNYATNNTKYM